MDLLKAQIILEKINTLYKNISIDSNVSAIERDLMLSYIRNLYETFLEDETHSAARKFSDSRKSEPVVVAPVVEEKIEPTPRPKARVVELPDSLKEYTAPSPSQKPAPTPKPEPIVEHVAPTPTPKPIVVEKEHEVLFEQKEAKELSEKLSEMPIRDLKKAMGLNEKILTINELFGGDNKAFDKALGDLNGLSTFAEAKNYMSENLAAKYDWSSKEKKKKAQIFIKLVKRRYV